MSVQAGSFWEPLLENTARALEAMRQRGVPVVYVVTCYRRDRSDWPAAWQHLREIWCLEGTTGVEIMAPVRPVEGEPVVVKTREYDETFYSAMGLTFKKSDLSKTIEEIF